MPTSSNHHDKPTVKRIGCTRRDYVEPEKYKFCQGEALSQSRVCRDS